MSLYLFQLLLAITLTASVSSSTTWSYETIDEWDDLNHSYCSGQETIDNQQTIYPQSPINIDTTSTIKTNTCQLNWELNDTSTTTNISYELTNTGHSLKLTPVQLQSETNIIEDILVDHQQSFEYYLTNNTFSIAQLNTDQTSSTNSDEQFCLHSIHFHWATNNSMGSEHTINKIQYPLEAHFVHYMCNYSNIFDAISAGESLIADGNENPYTLAVVAILYDLENDTLSMNSNSAFDAIFDAIGNNSLPIESNTSSVFVNDLYLSDLLPETLEYYTYEGSLTTPLCIPIVRWYVLQNMVGVSVEHMMSFRDILDMDLYREIQSLVSGAYVSECDIVDDGSGSGSGSGSSSEEVHDDDHDHSADDDNDGRVVIIVVLVVVCIGVICILVYFLKTKTNCMTKIRYSSVAGSQDDRYTHHGL